MADTRFAHPVLSATRCAPKRRSPKNARAARAPTRESSASTIDVSTSARRSRVLQTVGADAQTGAMILPSLLLCRATANSSPPSPNRTPTRSRSTSRTRSRDRTEMARTMVLEYLRAHCDRRRFNFGSESIRLDPEGDTGSRRNRCVRARRKNAAQKLGQPCHYARSLPVRSGNSRCVEQALIPIIPVATETPPALFSLGGSLDAVCA